MGILIWVSTIISILYGVITLIGGLAGLKVKKIQKWSSIIMAIFGVLLISSSMGNLSGFQDSLIYIIISLIGIHIVAINNGMKIHGKITPKHHIIRLIISIIIVLLVIF